jgi:tetraacyldisaccharide 4'-kinase
VIALVQALKAAGHRPGVISRGHGRRDGATREVRADSPPTEVGDEPLLIRRRTTVPTWVGARRIDAARALCAAHPDVDLLVADDGLQHRALARDVQVVVFDERGLGNGRLLPAGPLRQPVPRHVPVNTLVLYNAAAASTAWDGPCADRRLAGVVRLRDWRAGMAPSLEALAALRGRPLVAAAGMAVPQRFFMMLRAVGLAISPLPLPDHYAFEQQPWPPDAGDVLLTEKDAVKLPPRADAQPRLWVVGLDFRLPDGFVAALRDNLQRVTRR